MLNVSEVERSAAKATDVGDGGELMEKNPFYSLLGDCYTIVVSEATAMKLIHPQFFVWAFERGLEKHRVSPLVDRDISTKANITIATNL